MTRFVVATSSANDLSGFCTAVAVNPSSSKIGIIFFQLVPSANAPCTSTMEGLLLFESFIFLSFCINVAGLFSGRCDLDQINHDVHVATRGFGIRTSLVRGINEGLSKFVLQTRQAYVKASLEVEAVFTGAQVDFGIND